MATLAFKPYTYKPTAPRSKSTATHRRPAPEQFSILNKLQHITSCGVSLNTPRPAADDRGYRPGIRGTGTVFGGSDKANNDETDDDDRDLPTIEELLFTNLQAQGFTTGGRGPDKTGGVEEAAAEERGGSADQSRSAPGDNSAGSPEGPIVLLADSDSSASEAKVNDVSLRAESAAAPGAGLFDGPETAIDSITPAPPCSSDGWHDIDDFPETAPRLPLAEQGASTSNSTHPHTPSSLLSSEPLHDSISTEGSRHARSKATTFSSSPHPRHCRASPETQLSQDSRLRTSRGVADEHELVDHALDALLIGGEGTREQQEVEQEQDEGHSEDEDEGPQQEVNSVAPAVTVERAGGSPGPANGRQSLPNLDPFPEPNHDEAGSRSDRDSDDELNNTESDEDDEERRPAKRKRSSSSRDGPMRKKPKYRLQQRSTGQRRPRSKPHRQYPKSQSPLDQCSRVATSSRAKDQLPSPTPSTPQSIDTKMPLEESSLGRSSRATSPTLTEITFRPHSAHCYSFTATIRDGCDGRGVSLGQLARLITSTGHVGKINDFTIKPIEQRSYLLSGFSRHVSSRPSFGGAALSTTAEAGRTHKDATRTRPRYATHAQALASQGSEPSSSDDDGDLSDSDPDPRGDDDRCLSEEKQGLSTGVNIPWDPIDEQRLLAWRKEGKSWKWIFRKFKGRRTLPALRQRPSVIKRRR